MILADAYYAYVKTRIDADGPWNCFITIGEDPKEDTFRAMVMVELAGGGMKVATHTDGTRAESISRINRHSALIGLRSVVGLHVQKTMNASYSSIRPHPLWDNEDGDDNVDSHGSGQSSEDGGERMDIC